ncbi:MAG: glycerophosphodiester phosphodiesterase [Nitrospirota bacterium]
MPSRLQGVPPRNSGTPFLKVGHRGARAYETENTLESYEKAIKLGVNAVELDVRQSGDGRLVVSHDDSLKRIFGSDIRIQDATLDELKQLSGGRVPSLEEALRFIDKKVDKILVELKEGGYEKKVLDVVRKLRLQGRVIVVSFNEQALLKVREEDGKIETGLVYAKHKKPIDAALKLNAKYLLPLYRFTHTRNVEDAHKKNLKVVVWTINTAKEAQEYIAKGVDGIATDRPDIFN